MRRYWVIWVAGGVDRAGRIMTIDEVRGEEPDYPEIYAGFRSRDAAERAALALANAGRERLLAGPNCVRGMHEYLERRGPYTADDLGVYGTPVVQEWLDTDQVIVVA